MIYLWFIFSVIMVITIIKDRKEYIEWVNKV
jgi:hypothetical protein